MGAIGYYLVIDKIKEEEVKRGGLFIPESQNKEIRHGRAKVVSVGESVENIHEGDIIRYDKHAGHGIELDGNNYLVVRIGDVVYVE